MTTLQLPLPIELDDEATLDNLLITEGLSLAVSTLNHLLQGATEGLLLWGAGGTGKSHLLQAACHAIGDEAWYLPLGDLLAFSPMEVLDQTEAMRLIAIDDLHLVSATGQRARDWQQALFHWFNRRRDRNMPILMASADPPAAMADMLPDLRSRLEQQVVLRLPALADEDLRAILAYRAQKRGLEFSAEVLTYLLNRLPRSSGDIMVALAKIDREALAQGRAVTVPFLTSLRLTSTDLSP